MNKSINVPGNNLLSGNKRNQMQQLPSSKTALVRQVAEALYHLCRKEPIFPAGVSVSKTAATVLFLIGFCRQGKARARQPCFIFNKRSMRVRQAGDLCFPGGRMMPRMDLFLSYFLKLPFSPLSRWPYWSWWRKQRPLEARRLSLLLTAGLREGLEEMRLNPLGVRLLGPLPSQSLRLFQREIYPMVVLIERQQHFFPNWEVEKIITVPIQQFLNPAHYAACRLSLGSGKDKHASSAIEAFPCFRLPDVAGPEILWGATYRMVINFLEVAFDFRPPPLASLPVVRKQLGEEYIGNQTRPAA